MGKVKLTIDAERSVQNEILKYIQDNYPDKMPTIPIQKGLEASEIISISIGSAGFLINLIQLIIAIKKNKPNSKIKAKIEKDSRKLEITTNLDNVDINKIAEDFLNSSKK